MLSTDFTDFTDFATRDWEVFLTTDFHGFSRIFATRDLGVLFTTDFTDICYASVGARRVGCADALSGRSGASVVLLKYTFPR